MRESPVLHRIMLGCSRGLSRLFRMNVGLAWVGEAQQIKKAGNVYVEPGDVVVRNARPFGAGIKGMSDLVGWTSREITPEDVGKLIAIYTAIEAKGSTGRPTEDQLNFIAQVLKAGGLAGVAYNEEQAKAIQERKT